MSHWVLHINISLLFILFTINAFSQIKVELINDAELTGEGLYFEGTKGINYQFGKQITPHGDCIDVINGYVFVTWYKGGMDKRNLMVSRKKIDGGEWKTIQFPDKHIGYRGDPTKGDSHNTAAIAICPIDGTVHLLYDMHAYSKNDFPNNYFNYRVSKKNAAFVRDDEWNIALFNPKRHYLKEDVNYEKSTYPGFLRFDDGRIMTELRFGGSGNGDIIYAVYDGNFWQNNIKFNLGMQADYEKKYSIYGSFQYLNNKMYSGFSIRYKSSLDGKNTNYELNNGLYIAASDSPYLKNNWTDYLGNSISLPVINPDAIKVAEPCAIGIGKRISMGPIWTVTKNGAIHFLTAVSGNDVHFYKPPDSNSFHYSENCPKANGNFFCLNNKILNIALENNRVIMRTTPEGQNNWEVLYQQSGGDRYRHFKAVLYKNRLFLYLMKVGSADAQPLTLLTFLLTDESSTQINSKKKSKLKIYPNPVKNKITISGECPEKYISVYNLNGQKKLEFEIRNQSLLNSYDISTLKNGVYFLKTKTDTEKFVKLSVLN